MTGDEELEILLYESPFKNNNAIIDVQHTLSFEGGITSDDTIVMIQIFKLLQEHGFINMKHTVYLDKKQEYLTHNNTVFDRFHKRLNRYFCILKIMLGYDN